MGVGRKESKKCRISSRMSVWCVTSVTNAVSSSRVGSSPQIRR